MTAATETDVRLSRVLDRWSRVGEGAVGWGVDVVLVVEVGHLMGREGY